MGRIASMGVGIALTTIALALVCASMMGLWLW